MVAILASISAVHPVSAQSPPQPILKSGQMPIYPPIARAARIEGEVKVTFVLNEKGEVESVDVKSGLPMLNDATADIVKSWSQTAKPIPHRIPALKGFVSKPAAELALYPP